MTTATNAGSTDLAGPGARCTVYRNAPSWNDARTAAIGRLAIDDPAAGSALLADACARLTAEGFGAVLAPLEGDTWHSYRVVTETDGSPPFALEPTGGPHDLACLRSAGFRPAATYLSTRVPLGDAAAPKPVPGVRVDPWSGTDPDALLGELFAVATRAFRRNAFFKPIDRSAFDAIYAPLLTRLDRRLVLFARDTEDRLVGFLFGLPDLAEGPAPTTVILKTYASLRFGAGRLLADMFHQTAAELGFRSVIHALMHADNLSASRSAGYQGTVFRRYALMGRSLAP